MMNLEHSSAKLTPLENIDPEAWGHSFTVGIPLINVEHSSANLRRLNVHILELGTALLLVIIQLSRAEVFSYFFPFHRSSRVPGLWWKLGSRRSLEER